MQGLLALLRVRLSAEDKAMQMKFSRSHFRLQALQKPGSIKPVVPSERFVMGTKDNFKTFQIFEWLDGSHTQLVCTTTSEAYAELITAALNAPSLRRQVGIRH